VFFYTCGTGPLAPGEEQTYNKRIWERRTGWGPGVLDLIRKRITIKMKMEEIPGTCIK